MSCCPPGTHRYSFVFSFSLYSFTPCGLNSPFCALLSPRCVLSVSSRPLLSLSAEPPPAQTDSHSEADERAAAGREQGSDAGCGQALTACQALRIRGAVAICHPAHLASLLHPPGRSPLPWPSSPLAGWGSRLHAADGLQAPACCSPGRASLHRVLGSADSALLGSCWPPPSR